MPRREVRSQDPSLSPEANRRLTDELREVVGDDSVDVPEETPRRDRERHATRSPFVSALVNARLAIGVTFAVLLVVGAVVSLVTGSWWALIAALVVHFVGTVLVTGMTLHTTTEPEHLDPSTAAKLEEEGVANPDRMFNDLVEDYAGEQRQTSDVVTPGDNERTTRAEDAPEDATVEQKTAFTPTSEPSRPKPDGERD